MVKKICNFKIVRSFTFIFLYLPFDINQFSQFLFPILLTCNFSHSTFEHSLIFKFETSAILKIYCPKFQPWPLILKFCFTSSFCIKLRRRIPISVYIVISHFHFLNCILNLFLQFFVLFFRRFLYKPPFCRTANVSIGNKKKIKKQKFCIIKNINGKYLYFYLFIYFILCNLKVLLRFMSSANRNTRYPVIVSKSTITQ